VVHAVNGVSFNLDKGEALGIVGESGSGKSTCALSMMKLIPEPPGRIVDGEVVFDGQDLLKMSEKEIRKIRGSRIAMIFQDPMTSLNPVLTIGRQISEALELHMDMNWREARDRTIELLEMVGIPRAADRLNDYPHQFSGGMRQRAMIAIALSCDPEILVADEATTNLDVTIQAQIMDVIQRLRKELGMAIIWITHDLGIIASLVERVVVMYTGYLVEQAAVDDLYDDPRHPYTIGLLGSVPRLDEERKKRLFSMRGLTPDLIHLSPNRCPFAPRCDYAIERCWDENPKLGAVAPDHQVACCVDVKT
jgi:oligopeptide transport system ATP-binding protein